MRFLLGVLLLQLFNVQFLCADNSLETNGLEARLLEKGRAFYEDEDKQNYDSSYVYYHRLAEIYQKKQKWAEWSYAVRRTTLSLRKKWRLKESIEYLKMQLNMYLSSNKKDEFVAIIYGDMGISLNKLGQTQEALQSYKIALEIFHQIQLNTSFEASIYKNTANIHTRLTNYDQAIELFEVAIEIQTQLRNNEELHKLYCDLSYPYHYKSETEKELQCLQKAENLSDISQERQGFLEVLKGSYHKEQGEFPKALKYLQSALPKMKRKANLADAHLQLASIYRDLKNWNKAQGHLIEAKKLGNQAYGRFHRDAVQFHVGFGDWYLAQNDLASALQEYHKGLTALFPMLDESKDALLNPSLENLYVEPWIMTILQHKGDVLQKMYDQNKDSKLLEKALECYELSLAEFKMRQRSFDGESSKIELNNKWHSYYEKALQTSIRLWKTTQNRSYLARAFYWADKSKANLLIQDIEQSADRYWEASDFSGQYLDRREKLQGQTYFFAEKLTELEDSAAIIALYQDSLQKTQRQLSFLLDTLRSLHPNYQQLDDPFNDQTLPQLQKQIKPNQLLVEYFMGDSTRILYVFGITSNQILLEEIPPTEDLEKQLKNFSDLVKLKKFKTNSYQAYTENASAIYQSLLQPILMQCKFNTSQTPKLTFIPDGILHAIPFEALLTQTADNDNKQVNFLLDHLHYLIEEYEIAYTQSATLWLNKLQQKEQTPYKKQQNALKTLLAFAPVVFGGEANETADGALAKERSCSDESLWELIESEAEVNAIYRLIGGDLYVREKASKKQFIDLAEQYRILHLATHACVKRWRKTTSIRFTSPKKPFRPTNCML